MTRGSGKLRWLAVSAAAFALLASGSPAPATARPLDEVTASGTLKLALYKENAPWGSPLSDLMLQVPNDRVLTTRDDQIALTSPYFMQKLAFAYNKEKLGRLENVADIGTSKVAVEGTSASDISLMTLLGGRFRANANHFLNFEQAVKAYKAGEEPVIAGTEAQIQAAFHDNGVDPAEMVARAEATPSPSRARSAPTRAISAMPSATCSPPWSRTVG